MPLNLWTFGNGKASTIIWWLLSSSIIGIANSQRVDSQPDVNFKVFVNSIMEGYNTWAEGQSLNSPYRVKTQSVSILDAVSTMFNLNMTFFDMTVVNGLVSQDAEFGSWTNSSTYILDGKISSEFKVPSVSITGSHTTTGTILGRNVETSGTWTLDLGLYLYYYVYFEVRGNNLFPTNSSISGMMVSQLQENSINMTMGGLFTGDEDANVREMIMWDIANRFGRELVQAEIGLAMNEPLDTFFLPIIQETAIPDMIRPRSQWLSFRQEEPTTEPPISKAFKKEASFFMCFVFVFLFL